MASAGGERLSTSDFKKKREIEEARKNGTLPPEQDADGNLINPHNPEYISKRPWYLGDSGPSLKHQTLQHQAHLLSIQEADELYLKGRKQQTVAEPSNSSRQRKWRKGACKNCGAMSHKTNECVERPRKVGAWKTNKDLKKDEVVVDVRSERFGKLAFDAKRDQWLGYDPKEHTKTIERYEKVDAARKKLRAEEINKKLKESADKKKERKRGKAKEKEKERDNKDAASNSDSDSDSDSDYESDLESEDEEFRDHDEGPMFTDRVARQGGVGGAQMKTTVRNLRIREDTAKYLRNLNPNSAYYDPKTRSMRDNPNPELNPEDTTYTGDNLARFTGDTQRLASAQLFAWEAYSKGTDIHPLANPSQAEFLKKQYEERKAALEKEKSRKILDKYGGQEHLEAPPKELLLAQSEQYVEYSRDGRVVKGRERAPMAWGYACCHSKVRKSYCTGDDGKKALEESKSVTTERPMLKVPEKLEAGKQTDGSAVQAGGVISKRSEMYGENMAPELDEKKLKKAIKKATKQKKQQADKDEKKRKYNSMGNYEVNAEDMEAYRLLKTRGDDPMAKVFDSEVLLEENEGTGKRAKR
ncbi:hypothetical protein BBO99_00003636 [Phytophthora kernoviae]|uniref:Pre-mRNA-splicing factor SLU7 n=1 Tax=Phytophthora kernoviae TaxID=325452 RepID=A0A3R7JF27_9STRA|nr:hypothetical protein BBI17_003695 [Phytophthora kernoviae]RLN81516.1 hypothetical protein BBO99_00003636 [Phytophthora kernoviae]